MNKTCFSFKILALMIALGLVPAFAGPLEGVRDVNLVQIDDTRVKVGTITFKPSQNGTTYSIEWDDSKFSDHFLSMRPFKCVEGSKKYWCRVPYPYEIKRNVSFNDLTDLEYDTMFIWKGSKEYGINMWNGVYYRMKIDGDRIVGSIHELDMDKLSAPPEKGILRPLREQDLEKGEPESHWLPKLIIE